MLNSTLGLKEVFSDLFSSYISMVENRRVNANVCARALERNYSTYLQGDEDNPLIAPFLSKGQDFNSPLQIRGFPLLIYLKGEVEKSPLPYKIRSLPSHLAAGCECLDELSSTACSLLADYTRTL